jgi:predicted RNase H-like nuclease
MTLVAGADVTKGRWVVVVLRDGDFDRAIVTKNLADILGGTKGLEVLAVDIPIGLPEGKEHRQCDLAAKAFLKPRSSSVFFTPPRPVLEAPTYQEGNQLSWHDYERGVSAQAYALGQKILEVDPIAASDDRVIEIHPEVCFRAMNGEPLDYSKHSWNGQAERRRLIAGAGIGLPDHLSEAGQVPPDDILDAAAAAWTAWRLAQGTAKVLPESANGRDRILRGVIWY